MKCCCPECGHVDRLLAFAGEADARECLLLATYWPPALGDALIRYLQLFRPRRKALAWSRALRLMQTLSADIERGIIQRRGRSWAAPHAAWQDALATVVARRDELTLPLKDHAYLYEIICRGANRHEAAAEQQVEDRRRNQADRRRSAQPAQPAGSHAAPPPGGSLKAALAQARRATVSPAQNNEGDH